MKLKAPDVSISIDSSPSMLAAKDIGNGLLDLAVGYQYSVTRGVVFESLFDERLILVTSMDDISRWRENYIAIGWDDQFEDEQRQFIGELDGRYRIRAQFIDVARAILLREPASTYVVERFAKPLIKKGLISQVSPAPIFKRAAYAIYPTSPTHPDVQSLALKGLRSIAGDKP